MVYCPECGKSVSPTAKFCRNCGAPQLEEPAVPVTTPAAPQRVTSCNACGSPVDPDDSFCGNCGIKAGQVLPAPTVEPKPQKPQMTCPSCGAPVNADTKFCGICGSPVPGSPFPQGRVVTPVRSPVIPVAVQPAARPCRSCGNPIKPGDKFCGKCCARVVDEPPVFSPSQKVPGLPVSPPSPQAGKMQSPACSSCGSPVSADEKFCGICGAPVAVAPAPAPEPAPVPAAGNICAGCGAPLSATAKFCGICGAKVQK